MTDRVLLELAAKAAGYDVVWNDIWGSFQHRNPTPDHAGQYRHVWVPLEDDGDALRLAVARGMQVHINLDPAGFSVIAVLQSPNVGARSFVETEGDRLAATRRAIVRAAAESKEMP